MHSVSTSNSKYQLENGYPFYRLDKFGAKLYVFQSREEGVYGETTNGIQSYYDPYDWLLVQDGDIVRNLGADISDFAAQSYIFCIPADQDSNDFLERSESGSSYHMYISNHTGESVFARFLFTAEDENPWEVVFPPEHPLMDSQYHQYCTKTFMQCYCASDIPSKNYLEYILRMHSENIFEFTETGQYESLESPLSISPIPLEAFLGKPEPEPNPDEWTIEARLPCDCHAHEMSIWASNDSNQCVEFGYWQHGKSEQPWSMKTRLKTIFDILATGNPYADMLLLSRNSAEKLRDTLNEFLDKTK